jgi:hypothetical protein
MSIFTIVVTRIFAVYAVILVAVVCYDLHLTIVASAS